MVLTDKAYQIWKFANECLAIIGTLITTLLGLYGVPSTTIGIVGGTITAIEVASIAILKKCESNYDNIRLEK